MRWIYRPRINTFARRIFRPFVRLLPDSLQFPITEPFRLEIPGYGALMIVGNPTSHVTRKLFWHGQEGYEMHATPIFLALAGDARVIVDVGANIGYYAMLASLANPRAAILGFEPMPAAYRYFTLNLQTNGFTNVRAEPLALSDHVGSVRFFEARNPKFPDLDLHLTGASGFDRPDNGRVASRAIEVPVETLDRYTAARAITGVDLMKIDAEGSEPGVLRGAAELIARDRPILFCEVLPGRVEEDMEAFVHAHAYRVFSAQREGLVPVDRFAPANRVSPDFVFVPQGREERVAGFLRA